MAINVDDIEKSFSAVAASLEISFPGLVLPFNSASDDPLPRWAKQHLDGGGILLDRERRMALGTYIGEDPLHVYKRLLQALDFTSRESAFAARSLQALLACTNPSNRHCFGDEELLGAPRALPRSALWMFFDEWEFRRPPAVEDILRAYFLGLPFPPTAAAVLRDGLMQPWTHPEITRTLRGRGHEGTVGDYPATRDEFARVLLLGLRK